MAKIEGFRIKNFRSLKDVTLGLLWNQRKAEPLAPMTAVIGKNGVGKSTLFDAFGFLADALKSGVEEACDSRGRGGFKRIKAQGQQGPIEFEVYYKEGGNARPITYEIVIDIDKSGRPFVLKERLRQRRKGGSQVFITTHQPYLVDALEPSEIWILEKGPDGFSIIRRASEDETVKNLVAEGLPLGGLWYSDYLDAR